MIGDRYVLGRVIGRGALGEVRQAEDLRLARSVAIKLLRRSADEASESDPSGSRRRFEEDVRAAARLSDRNVVAILDTGEYLGRPFIVMELLSGRTLGDELRDGPIDEARARDVIIDVLRALQAAHAAGVLHRDIKPTNILLTETGEAKVADFGLAAGPDLGTPTYLAPELVDGGAATVGTDLYAVGVVLSEAVGGQPSASLAAVVAQATARDPEARYRSATDMLLALEHETAPAITDADEPTLPVAVVPETIDATMLTEMPAALSRPRRSRARTIAKVLIPLAAVLIGAAIVLQTGTHRADTTTKSPPVESATTVAPARVTTTSAARARPVQTPVTTAPLAVAPTTAPPTTTPPATAPPTTAPPTTAPPTTAPPTTAPPTTAPITAPPITAP